MNPSESKPRKSRTETMIIPAARTTQDAASLLGKGESSDAKDKKASKQINMDLALKTRIHALAVERGSSLKNLLEEIVTKYLDGPEGDGK